MIETKMKTVLKNIHCRVCDKHELISEAQISEWRQVHIHEQGLLISFYACDKCKHMNEFQMLTQIEAAL